MAKIIDIFSYNGEADILEIRLNILKDFVDEFIIVEAPTTFSGLPKPLYYEQQKERFKKWNHKIRYFIIPEDYSEDEIALAKNSPNTLGAKHWTHEFLQKESIKKSLTHLKDDDICFIGDVDEIWSFTLNLGALDDTIFKLNLRVYAYYLNNRSNEEFYGTIVSCYKNIKNKCLNHLRSHDHGKTKDYHGFHFTSIGGYEEIKRKLNDSYTEETYNSPFIQQNLKTNMANNKDFLGRDFKFTQDESDWPQYLKDNRDKYKHLLI